VHVTGALPARNGVVANEMMDLTKPFGTRLSGFDAPIRAETLWQAARRQGRRTGILLYPGASGPTPERSGDFGMRWENPTLAEPRVAALDAAAWRPAPAGVPSFSPARATTLVFAPTAHAVTLVARDATDDGRADYDRVRVETEDGGARDVAPGEWFPVEVRGEAGRAGAWCRLLRLDPDLARAEVYVGALAEAAAYPEEFRRRLDDAAGFWPGRPDEKAFGADSEWPEALLEQSERLADYVTRATLAALERRDWDLLLVYEPEVDEISHVFLLTESAQPGYTPERAARFARIVDGVWDVADRSLDRIARALVPGDAIVVTSDHGMTTTATAVYPNEILRASGDLRRRADGSVDPASFAVAMAGSGVANVYVNAATAPPGTAARLVELFGRFRADGVSPWDRVLRRADAGPLGLDAPESGDVILLARPGVGVSMSVVPGRVSGPASHYGGHGYRNVFPALDAAFLAAGPGVAPGRVDDFPSWRIAGFLARLVGMDPPRDAAP
jgi:hypothetical protein